jgi:Spy/CpxP family protein refolding chaperone
MSFNRSFYRVLSVSALAIVIAVPQLAIAKSAPSGAPLAPTATMLPKVSPTPSAKPTTKPSPAAEKEGVSLMDSLKLTAEQKQKIRGVRSARTRQINQLLTEDQRAKFKKSRESGVKLSDAIKALGLPADKSKQVVEIIQKSQQDIRSALTPAQLKTLDDAIRSQKAGGSGSVE